MTNKPMTNLEQEILDEIKIHGELNQAQIDQIEEAMERVREDEREKIDRITQIIQAKLDRNDSPSLKAGLLYALTIIKGL